ncbi:MAG: tol-pal system-associated acyl-CoA thioesterase [Rhodospirillaceae bacterium]|nr:tol-pal system-associated acyl-CoA thioesterase [Rhodospirillaceae bacterium]
MTDSGGTPDRQPAGSPAAGPAAGVEPVHVFPVRVYYEDTDAGGIVYYANYLKFAERARTELLRQTGRQQFDLLRERGIGFTVRSCRAEYLAPARLDDILEIRSTVNEVLGASMRLSQRIYRGERLLCDLRFRIAVMNREGRPTRIPKDIRDTLAPRIVPPDEPEADEAETGEAGCGSTPRRPAAPRDCHSYGVDPSAEPV